MANAITNPAPIYLLKGGDEILLSRGASDLIKAVIGDRAVDEVLDEYSGDEYNLGELVQGALTVSMFGGRVVVGRNAGRFNAQDATALIDYLASPSLDTSVIIVWERPMAPNSRLATIPKKLTAAVEAAGGEVRDFGIPSGKARTPWIAEQLEQRNIDVIPEARNLILDHIGEDLNRLGDLLDLLVSVHGSGTKLTADDVRPYLGQAGVVPPWDLTDAIDRGDLAGALDTLARLLGAGDRHPLQIMVSLHSHFERMLRLDGSGASTDQAAADVLQMKGSTFPAKKARLQASNLGSTRIKRAIELLAEADADIRGRTALESHVVVEILVARLAALAPRRSNRRR